MRALASLLALAILLAPAAARAAAYVELTADPPNPQAGEIIHVRYAVRIRNETAAQVAPLDFGQLELLSDPSPPQLPMMWGGGFAVSIDTASEYVLRAPAPGRYTISGARVIHAGTGRVIAQHPPLTLVVGAPTAPDDAGAVDAFVPPPPQDPDAPPLGDLTGAEYDPTAFLRVALDTPEPYLGQQVVLRVWLYVASTEANCEITREPQLSGFWNESLLPPMRECAARWFTSNVGGRYMSVGLVRRIALFPTQTGELTIGPMAANVEVLTGGLFRSLHRVEAHSPPLQVTVREPPAAGRPPGYVPGTVGPVSLVAQADRDQVAVGETVTVTVRATSEGSLASARIEPPSHLDGVRVRVGDTRAAHDASAGRVTTTLLTEFLIVPERPGTFDLGEVALPYWDPAAERYGVARTRLPVVRATGAALPAERPAAAGDAASELRPLTREPSLRPHASLFARGPLPVAVVAAPPLAFALAGMATALGRRAARRARSRAEAKRSDPAALVREAKRALEGDPARAVSLAGRALDRAVARAREQVEGGLAALPAEVRGAVDDARQACDAARFAGEAAEPRDVVTRVERAVRAIEGAL
jgi:hypothetical protein